MAANARVDRSASVVVLEGESWTSHFRIKLAGNREQGIPPSFDFKATSIKPPAVKIITIQFFVPGISFAGKLIGCRSQNLTMQPFERPTVLNELYCQPVEQFRMSRGFAQKPKVT